jgi:predicted N-acetyltransferase YhbS
VTEETGEGIRSARADEVARLSDLAFRSKAYWGYPDAFMEACREELSLDAADLEQDVVFVLERAGAVLGFYALEPLSAVDVELGLLFVEPSEMGRGIGRRLLAHACAEARRRGWRRIVIQSDPNAAAFYTSCGARAIGVKPSASIPDRSLPLLEIDLRG